VYTVTLNYAIPTIQEFIQELQKVLGRQNSKILLFKKGEVSKISKMQDKLKN